MYRNSGNSDETTARNSRILGTDRPTDRRQMAYKKKGIKKIIIETEKEIIHEYA